MDAESRASTSVPEVEKAAASLVSPERLADYFAIVGLNDELKPLDAGYDCKCQFFFNMWTIKSPTRKIHH